MPFRTSSTAAPLATLAAIASLFALMFACGNGGDGTGTAVEPARSGDGGPSPDGTNGADGDDTASPRPTVTDGGMAPVISPDAGPPALRFVGRFDTRDSTGPTCAWPGCRIIANFEGTEVKARLDEHVEDWMQGGPSEWDITIDGVLQPKLVLDLGTHDYILASELPAGPHSVELYKRSEAQNGYTQFLGYDFGNGALLPPPLPASRRIEFVGDSAAAGFGIEGVGLGPDCPGPDWSAHWQDFHKSMGARLAEMLHADLHGTIYSGKGIARNIWTDDFETMPVLYGRANPIDRASVFDLHSYIPDVYVLMMGGNDFAIGQPYDSGPTTPAAFTQATQDLVMMMRNRAPKASIFLAVSPSLDDAEPPDHFSRTYVETAFDKVARDRTAAGDARVYGVVPPKAARSELTACNGHGTPAFHDRVAAQLATVIQSKTGWR